MPTSVLFDNREYSDLRKNNPVRIIIIQTLIINGDSEKFAIYSELRAKRVAR